MNSWVLVIVIFLLQFGSSANSAVLPLFSPEVPATRPDDLVEWINRASSFYVWQNDPSLSDLFVRYSSDGSGATDLCVPSAIGNALLREYSRVDPQARSLRVPGLTPDGASVDTSALIRELGTRCGDGGLRGTFEPWGSAMCIRQIFRESGYFESTVRLIRSYGERVPVPGLEYLNRAPTLQDLARAIREGYQVIASFAHMKWNIREARWVKTSGHSVNVVGFGRKSDWANSSMILYVQNPTNVYKTDFIHPIFDEITLKVRDDLTILPAAYSNIEAKGGGRIKLNYPGKTTFLSGLILLNANPSSLQEDQLH